MSDYFKPLSLDKLVELTNKRIGSLKSIELAEAMAAIYDSAGQENELLEAIRSRDEERVGKALLLWLSIYCQADIKLHGGL